MTKPSRPNHAARPAIRLVSTTTLEENAQESLHEMMIEEEDHDSQQGEGFLHDSAAHLSTPFPVLPLVTAPYRFALLPVLVVGVVALLLIVGSIVGTRLWMSHHEASGAEAGRLAPPTLALPLPVRPVAERPPPQEAKVSESTAIDLEPLDSVDSLRALTEAIPEESLAPTAGAENSFPPPKIVVHDAQTSQDRALDETRDSTLDEAATALAQGDLVRASTLYTAALATQRPEDAPLAWQGLLHTLESLGGSEGYETLTGLVRQWPQRADVHATLGSVALQIGRASDAVRAFERALVLAGTQTSRETFATPPAKRRETATPSDALSPAIMLAWQRGYAIALDRAGRMREARDAYRQLMNRDPQVAQSGVVRARLAWLESKVGEK